MIKLGVLASGQGTNLQAIIDASLKGEIEAEVSVVISDKREAYALKRAEEHSIPAIFINRGDFSSKEEYEREIIKNLQKHEVSLVILAGYMRVVGKEFAKEYKGKMMNIHPALLPSFPGLKAWEQAYNYGVKVSGVTVHFVEEGVDTGPVILQRAVEVKEDDTLDSLLQRIHQEEYKIYPQAIQLFAQGKLKIEGRRVRII